MKSRLAAHGLYGSFAHLQADPERGAGGTFETIEIVVKGRRAARSFERQQIERCCLRVGGEVLSGLIAMIEEVST
jgi:hypothetical protein